MEERFMHRTTIRSLLFATLGLLALACARAQAPFAGLPFQSDDYAAALAEARAKDLPLFVSATAPWCHACRSMKAYVFTDARLAPVAARFVWLDLDIENPDNAPFRARHPVPAVPTYFVFDPREERPLMRFVGGTSVERLLALLDEAALAHRGEAPARLAEADAHYAAGRDAEAIAAYQDVLDTADPGAPYFARTVESMLFALSRAGDRERGLALAEQALPLLRAEPGAGSIVSYGLDFAIGLPQDHPERPARMAEMERQALEIVNDMRLDMAADDRSGVYIALLGARQAVGDARGRRMIAEQWAAFLERAAAAARTPAERTVFDSHRLSASIEIGAPEKAIPFLEQSERDFPDDYNPPARLAIAYREMKAWDRGIEAAARALAKSGTAGPRRLLILQNLAQLHEGRGDVAAARRTLAEAIAHGEALPEGARAEARVNALRRQLEALGPA
jgi:tetratricopeptide (TPR) repeat protein